MFDCYLISWCNLLFKHLQFVRTRTLLSSCVRRGIDSIGSKWHEPIHHNKKIHYAHKVLEWNIASVDSCAGELIIRRQTFHSMPSESRLNRMHRFSLGIDRNEWQRRWLPTAYRRSPARAHYCPYEERTTRNWPNNNFNNIVCLILELFGVYSCKKKACIIIIIAIILGSM